MYLLVYVLNMTTAIRYDAVIIVTFGGPNGTDDVMPFLDNVLRGRNVPEARKREVAHHYDLFDGVSPINTQNEELAAALRALLKERGPEMSVYIGNRNWHPFLADTFGGMKEDGVKRALAFVASAYSCYSGCRQYREDIARAREEVGDGAPVIDKIRLFYNHPLFIQANADRLRVALRGMPSDVHVVFTAHSIPSSMSHNCNYSAQLKEASRLVAERAMVDNWTLVYQSRSGSPGDPWLEPDICDHLRELKGQGVRNVVISPVGFVSDHMEVVYDLDMEAGEVCDEVGLNMVRVPSAGTHPDFVEMIRELILERTSGAERRYLGLRGAWLDECPPNCCLPGESSPFISGQSGNG